METVENIEIKGTHKFNYATTERETAGKANEIMH